ncbi:MAG: hypothetical protein HY785_15690 [Oscillatoriophycideae cyanobacterium NC_groundwater_1537_Pr4_S-0.65um_50_18]|nr:hypothetical protein [Oscillatoriophycideae cyanobacterium NC_groundwater_1537_Pr4_S-0.65um_50_18]
MRTDVQGLAYKAGSLEHSVARANLRSRIHLSDEGQQIRLPADLLAFGAMVC